MLGYMLYKQNTKVIYGEMCETQYDWKDVDFPPVIYEVVSALEESYFML